MIDVFYFSKTGNTESFAKRLSTDCLSITDKESDNQFILLTPTYFFGQVPEEVDDWLSRNELKLIGVIGFGNRNWGSKYFGRAADIISESFGVPVLAKVELRGTDEDVESVDRIIESLRRLR
ncbi:class Ib ribonucleoside-diphosphate reductase assembly flavoprotein NrdI [Staphylococcus felis]|uniref:Class Ib ribonucleoside-diphosphate reductase assembly flavoprotein NrdI n=1 Tax=Staphylococcus felis TaxID=46127 RepID=A0ABS0QLP6_9STAP|nr:class Ib ribonucleoside-diphosphate reductase assembly flavoprotein NrdI [Staphylococcus felis]MBH9580097.1 class Ib ribonucleoside-diphosphate reductase assembly flavoprotein NrdI [Staphylococcus felis]REI09509.1 class Ib ribonucleoside-diphosphate reductase assembly flavoprotein NrdI [Staphylococcus felis]REI33615.1 class Ib ribonucleoside-diphosphate reductase assembly flavoprotein NrdI [Staphylococcus felis]